MDILIGSKNPIKIQGVTKAFEDVFSVSINPEEQNIESGISNQPLSIEETITGAKNRAENLAKNYNNYEYYVGVEAGMYKLCNEHFSITWVYIINRSGNIGIGSSTSLMVIPKVYKGVFEDQKEMGDVLDALHNRKNMKQSEGYVGIMTNNVYTRKRVIYDATYMALVRFSKKSLFE